MAKNISIKVQAEDKASNPINEISGKINTLSNNLKKTTAPLTNFGKSLTGLKKSIPVIGMVTAAVVGVTKAVKSSVNQLKDWESEWAKADTVLRRLDFAASINAQLGESSRELKNFSSELSAKLKGAISSDSINEEIAKLSFDKTSTQIKDILSTATDLSVALGMDLSTAVTQLNNTFSGSVGTLGKYFPELKNISEEGLKAGEALALVKEKVEGISESMTTSTESSIQSYKNAVTNLKEALGSVVTNAITPFRNGMTEVIDKITAFINKYAEAKRLLVSGSDAQNYLSENKQRLKSSNSFSANENIQAGAFLEAYTALYKNVDKEFTDIDKLIKNYQQGGIPVTRDMSENWNDLKSQRDELKELYTLANHVVTQYWSDQQVRAQKMSKPASTVTDSASETVTGEESKPLYVAPSPDWDAYYAMMAEEMSLEREEEREAYRQQMEEQKAQELRDEQNLEALREIKNNIQEAFKDSILNNSGEVGKLISAVSSGNYMQLIASALGEIMQKIQNMSGIIDSVFKAITTYLGDLIRPLINIIEPILNPLLTIIQSQGSLLSVLVSLFQPFINFIQPIIATIGGTIVWLSTFIKTLFEYLRWAFTEVYNKIVGIYNHLVSKKKEVSTMKQEKAVSEINTQMKSLFNGDFVEDYIAQLKKNYDLGGSSTVTGGAATYNAARDVIVTINFNDSFVYADKTTLAVELAREIRNAEKMNLI